MIPSKDPGYYPQHDVELPVQLDLDHAEPALFTPRYAPLRKLVVMVDSEPRGTPGWHVMTILRSLRNTIHSVSLMQGGGEELDRPWGEVHTTLELSADLGDDFWTALDAVTDEDWTLGRCRPGDEVRPGDLLENVFPRVLHLLDQLVRAIPVAGHEAVARLLDQEPPIDYRHPEACRIHLGLAPTRPADPSAPPGTAGSPAPGGGSGA